MCLHHHSLTGPAHQTPNDSFRAFLSKLNMHWPWDDLDLQWHLVTMVVIRLVQRFRQPVGPTSSVDWAEKMSCFTLRLLLSVAFSGGAFLFDLPCTFQSQAYLPNISFPHSYLMNNTDNKKDNNNNNSKDIKLICIALFIQEIQLKVLSNKEMTCPKSLSTVTFTFTFT